TTTGSAPRITIEFMWIACGATPSPTVAWITNVSGAISIGRCRTGRNGADVMADIVGNPPHVDNPNNVGDRRSGVQHGARSLRIRHLILAGRWPAPQRR